MTRITAINQTKSAAAAKIRLAVTLLWPLLFLFFLYGCAAPADTAPSAAETDTTYAELLFEPSCVHTIDLQVENWEGFLAAAQEETYVPCTAVIDGESFSWVGLRTKGNNSKRLTAEYGLSRYSLKLEFDHYLREATYHGLDKLSLDSSFQDNSYMKTWLVFDMMRQMNVPTPLCSYVWVTVNGEPWGLFLAVEEPEDSFAERNFGDDHGLLYKPDYRSLNDDNADVDLRYIDEDPASYDNIFRNAKFDVTAEDQQRLISSLKTLFEGENLSSAVNVDEVLRYFAVQVFVMNPDSYLGPTGHNYYLYEKNGILSILPWDYNLAFGTYCLGMSRPIRDPNVLINYPVHTPWEGEVMLNRPLFHNLMKQDAYFAGYRGYLDELLAQYMESGHCATFLRDTAAMIAPYVEQDPTAFCTYPDFLTAADTLREVCRLRTEAVRGQLEGIYPATLAERERSETGVDASHLDLAALGDFDDLNSAKQRQEEKTFP